MEEATNEKVDRPLAVITGASSGIGYELAKQFAIHGYDLIIVSENQAIVEAAHTCRNLGAEVESFVIDLAEYNGVEELKEKISEDTRSVEAIAINTGIGGAQESDKASENAMEAELGIINLNIISSVHLARHLGRDMLKRKKGKILFTSSVVGEMPENLKAVYKASKAFIHSYSESIRNEFLASGVTVTELVPAEDELNFSQSAAEIAEHGFQFMVAGEGHVEAGSNKFKADATRANTPRAFGEPSKLKH